MAGLPFACTFLLFESDVFRIELGPESVESESLAEEVEPESEEDESEEESEVRLDDTLEESSLLTETLRRFSVLPSSGLQMSNFLSYNDKLTFDICLAFQPVSWFARFNTNNMRDCEPQ